MQTNSFRVMWWFTVQLVWNKDHATHDWILMIFNLLIQCHCLQCDHWTLSSDYPIWNPRNYHQKLSRGNLAFSTHFHLLITHARTQAVEHVHTQTRSTDCRVPGWNPWLLLKENQIFGPQIPSVTTQTCGRCVLNCLLLWVMQNSQPLSNWVILFKLDTHTFSQIWSLYLNWTHTHASIYSHTYTCTYSHTHTYNHTHIPVT